LINSHRQGVFLKFCVGLEERRPFAVIKRRQRGRGGKRVRRQMI
jgi:hypothetical protein